MSFRWVAFTAAMTLSCWFASAQAPRVLTLDSAFSRTLEKNPDLARFGSVREGARAALDAESQGPPLRLEFELENAPRTEQDSSFDSAETTLSLASVFERGGKREARAAAADAQLSCSWNGAGRATPRGSAGRSCAPLSRCRRGAIDGGARRCRGQATAGSPQRNSATRARRRNSGFGAPRGRGGAGPRHAAAGAAAMRRLVRRP